MYQIIDSVLLEISRDIAIHPPERGGQLLGPEGKMMITRFLFDSHAHTTPILYRTSIEVADEVERLEWEYGLEVKGIVHSHPNGFDKPSSGDRGQVVSIFEDNPHLSHFLLPIVTQREATNPHDIAVEGGKVSLYLFTRSREGAPRVREIIATVIPIHRDLTAIQKYYAGGEFKNGVREINGVQTLVGSMALGDGTELTVLFSDQYPVTPPIVLQTPQGQDTSTVHIKWNLDVPEEDRLLSALSEVIPLTEPSASDTRIQSALDQPLESQKVAKASHNPSSLFERSKGLLSESLMGKSVLIVGTGSGGSFVAEQLVRSGVGKITLVDPDIVETHNLSRSNYTTKDIGERKVRALSSLLLGINPSLEVAMHAQDLTEMSERDLSNEVEKADLVLGLTDSPKAQLLLCKVAYHLGTPALFAGLYPGAKGGEAIIQVPEQTSCYRCVASSRVSLLQEGSDQAVELDYGTGRLEGEVALGVDIHHLDTAVVKLALSLLTDDPQMGLYSFTRDAIVAGHTYLTMSMVPDYWFYPKVFEFEDSKVAGQYAYQSVWVKPERQDDCPICGDKDMRVAPVLDSRMRGIAWLGLLSKMRDGLQTKAGV